MWGKRKLTRKNLDELAKIMPVLSEEEQRESIGGTYFYDRSGNYIGEVGPGSDIKIVGGEGDLNALKSEAIRIGDLNYSSSRSWGNDIQTAKLEENALKNIIARITGYDANRFLITSGTTNDEAKTMYWENGSLISFDITSLSLKNADSLRSTMRHEAHHIANTNAVHPDGTPYTDWEHENSAYLVQTGASGFKSLPLEYRQKIAGFWKNEASKEFSGVIPDDINKYINSRCGIDQ